MNPTGNRTILVESPVLPEDYKKVATFLMEKEPTAEQVGFLDVTGDNVVTLNMAGGEFCGNATMSAAVLLCMKGQAESPVPLKVSGAKGIMKALVRKCEDGLKKNSKSSANGPEGKKAVKCTGSECLYTASVKMPSPVEIRDVSVSLGEKKTLLPAVIFDGIVHIILNGTGMARNQAEMNIRLWSGELNVPCLGMMFYDEAKNRLKPLVYVKNPETLVWENSCGSGSVAEAAWLYHNGIVKDSYEFCEPGGKLTVIRKGKTFYLEGTVYSEKEGVLEISLQDEETYVKSSESRKEKSEKVSKSRKEKTEKASGRAVGKTVKKVGEAKAKIVKSAENVKATTVKKAGSKEHIHKVLGRLDEEYGTDYKCYLNHENAWQLLFATIMSAQCTDERVNIVTKDLFVKYPDLEAFAKADLKELEQDIHSTGFYHNKAKNIIACAQALLKDYNGEVPSDIESLTSLPGVGRKTANVIRGNIYHIDSIVVDTHVKRISNKLGFTTEEDPVKIEFDLMEKLPKDHWILYNIHIIRLGRTICKAPTPKCSECFLKDLCPSAKGYLQ